jgi:hypothetical protein
MSRWRKLPNNMLSADESWFIGRYPQYVAKAFINVSYDDSDPQSEGWQWRPYHELVGEAIESFAKRWGGLDESIFQKVLAESRDRDRLVAIFAIGHSSLPQATTLLSPFLESTNQLERCAAACCLAMSHDERALPVLEEFLLCEPPTDEQGRPLPEAEIWYDTYRFHIARLLATWGPPSIVSVLRKAFLHLWEKEGASGSYQGEYNTHDALLYALGRRGALAALHGIALPLPRQRLAMLYLAAGYLHGDERFSDLYSEMIVNQAFQREIALVLTEHFALSEQESLEYIKAHGEDFFKRIDPDLDYEGMILDQDETGHRKIA